LNNKANSADEQYPRLVFPAVLPHGWSCGEEAGNSAQADGLDLPPHEKSRKCPEKHGVLRIHLQRHKGHKGPKKAFLFVLCVLCAFVVIFLFPARR
jgi:hypothetical protein